MDADSSGTDGRAFVSLDGGLTYTELASSGVEEGTALKAAAELDIGEWWGDPERYRVGLYFKELEAGFFSSGNASERDSRKLGLHAELEVFWAGLPIPSRRFTVQLVDLGSGYV